MKKFLTGTLALGAMIASLPMIAAFEAHIVNVTASISNALGVPVVEIEYGTVFPQEKLDKTFEVSLSEEFVNAANATTGIQWATSVVAFSQGVRKNGTAVLPDRSDPTKALGPAQSTGAAFDTPVIAGSFFSLGFPPVPVPHPSGGGGWIVLGFEHFIVNETGTDITLFEITGGPPYPDERVRVEAAQTSTGPWTLLASSSLKDASVDLGVLPWAKYIRITDVSNIALFEPTADGYDLDGVRARSREVLSGNVDYHIRQKPKCVDDEDPALHPQVGEDEQGNFVCPEGSTMMPLLCPYLSKHELTGDPDVQENDSAGINAFHGLPGPWNLATSLATQVAGALSATGDLSDTWNVDLRVPCFTDMCAQDWPNFVRTESGDPEINPEDYVADPALEHEIFGCDLWVEVTGLD